MDIRRVSQIALRRFIYSEAGQEVVLELTKSVPKIVKGDSTQMIFDAGRDTGWRECIDAIISIAESQPTKDTSAENPGLDE